MSYRIITELEGKEMHLKTDGTWGKPQTCSGCDCERNCIFYEGRTVEACYSKKADLGLEDVKVFDVSKNKIFEI